MILLIFKIQNFIYLEILICQGLFIVYNLKFRQEVKMYEDKAIYFSDFSTSHLNSS